MNELKNDLDRYRRESAEYRREIAILKEDLRESRDSFQKALEGTIKMFPESVRKMLVSRVGETPHSILKINFGIGYLAAMLDSKEGEVVIGVPVEPEGDEDETNKEKDPFGGSQFRPT